MVPFQNPLRADLTVAFAFRKNCNPTPAIPPPTLNHFLFENILKKAVDYYNEKDIFRVSQGYLIDIITQNPNNLGGGRGGARD